MKDFLNKNAKKSSNSGKFLHNFTNYKKIIIEI